MCCYEKAGRAAKTSYFYVIYYLAGFDTILFSDFKDPLAEQIIEEEMQAGCKVIRFPLFINCMLLSL